MGKPLPRVKPSDSLFKVQGFGLRVWEHEGWGCPSSPMISYSFMFEAFPPLPALELQWGKSISKTVSVESPDVPLTESSAYFHSFTPFNH